MEIGDAFLLEDSKIDPHLWVVISDPGKDDEQVVIVNLTSHDSPEKDDSCILDPGDHPWVRHKTSVRYRDARVASERDLDKLVKKRKLKPQNPVSNETLGKILAGAQMSPHFPLRPRRILQDQDLLER
ncbi:MAG: hypothetical protein WD847_11405 [Pirellulales bacterium]